MELESSYRPIDYVRSIAGIIVFFINIVIAMPIVVVLSVLSLGYLNNWLVENIGPAIANPPLAIIGINHEIRGAFPDYPAIYIINHSSTLDLLIILSLAIPKARFVAKWELQYNPIFFMLGRFTGQVFIQRKKSDDAVRRLQKSYDRMKHQQLSVMLAPEGSRKHPGIIGPFKKGPFRMAMDLNYPIVPIFIDGAIQLNPGGSLIAKEGTITSTIHDPISVEDWNLDNLEEKIAQVRARYLAWTGITEEENQRHAGTKRRS
jgi:1-acyl-sn-glycerol-3-phosphate acyltransferase